MKTAKLFKSGKSQAVRLPRAFRFEGNEVIIKKSGNAVVLMPLTNSWEPMIDSLDKFTPDDMSDRAQSSLQKRESIFE